MVFFGTATAFFMLGTGLLLTVRSRGFQFTHLFRSIKAVFRGGRNDKGGVTAFQAMATALGGSVGTANIAGTAGALAIGGPGAVFWMWVAGVLGMAVKCFEILLAVRFGGGAMICIERGMGRRFRPLALAFSFFGMLAGLVGTALVQSNTIALSVIDLVPSGQINRASVLAVSGVLTALLTAPVIFGGARRIGRFSEKAVPFMALAYVFASLAVIFSNLRRLVPSLELIITSAFGLKPVFGGACGLGAAAALRVGVARGVYSNEAGVGSAPMSHANSSETDPVKQGMLGIFEVFADTLVMCTLTALVILTSGVDIPYGSPNVSGTALARSAFAVVFSGAAPLLICSFTTVFAYTSIIGWSLYGETCAVYLFGRRSLLPYRLIYLALIALGASFGVDSVWRIGEALTYLMALPNLVMLLSLSRIAEKELSEYKTFEKWSGRHYNRERIKKH